MVPIHFHWMDEYFIGKLSAHHQVAKFSSTQNSPSVGFLTLCLSEDFPDPYGQVPPLKKQNNDKRISFK